MTGGGRQDGGQTGVVCPACSPEQVQVHDVLASGGDATVRCRECGHVHKTQLPDPSTISVRTVVSIGEESARTTAEVPQDETLAVGEEFVIDLEDGPAGVRITSLELAEGVRTDRATAPSIRTIWTRAIDNVAVDATIHPADGSREGTVGETYSLPGDTTLRVGGSIPDLDDAVRIVSLHLREDALGYNGRKLTDRNAEAPAKDVDRLYARRTDGDGWRSAWG